MKYRILRHIDGDAMTAAQTEVLPGEYDTPALALVAYREVAKDDYYRPHLRVEELTGADELHGEKWVTSDYSELMGFVEATEAGKAWARELKPGDPFHGCAPVARDRHQGDERLQRMFRAGAMDVLEQRKVLLDINGLLTDADGPWVAQVIGVGLIDTGVQR